MKHVKNQKSVWTLKPGKNFETNFYSSRLIQPVQQLENCCKEKNELSRALSRWSI